MIPNELLALYQGISHGETLYMKARWLVSPIAPVERALPRNGKIYDIGCGAGLLSNLAALSAEGRNVIGIDLSDEKIGIARKSIGNRRNISFERADALSLTLDHPAAVTICDTLHHIPALSQERLLSYVYRSLDRGGILLIQDIDMRPLHKYLFAFWVDMVLNRMQPVYYRPSGEWTRLLEQMGFQVKVSRLDKGFPIAAVLFECVKK